MTEINLIIEGIITGERLPRELTEAVDPESMPTVLKTEAAEFYRLQAIFRSAPDGHAFKQGAKDRMPGMVRVIEALGGKVILENAGYPLIARYWILSADNATIADNVVIAW